jgi:muramidase (phage lysozyme)
VDPVELIAALDQPNVRAFLQMLRLGEGTRGEKGYRTMFGGGLFDSFADHPRRLIKRGSLASTAAGAYQFLERTWDGLVKQYGFADFSPSNQDLACVALIKGRNALDDVIAGRFDAAVAKCNKEWASLPGSPYGQPTVTLERARHEYVANGGSFEGAEPIPPNPFPQEQPMLPAFLLAAIPSLVQAVPELIKILGSGSDVSERNAKAAELAVGIAKEALGAKNEQEVIETLAADPQAAVIVREAVKERWYELQEVGGGIEAARDFSLKAQGDKSVLHNPAFLISLLLLIFPLMLLVDVFYVHPESYSADGLRTQIVTGVLMVISTIGGFWLGTSFSSSKKDDALLRK